MSSWARVRVPATVPATGDEEDDGGLSLRPLPLFYSIAGDCALSSTPSPVTAPSLLLHLRRAWKGDRGEVGRPSGGDSGRAAFRSKQRRRRPRQVGAGAPMAGPRHGRRGEGKKVAATGMLGFLSEAPPRPQCSSETLAHHGKEVDGGRGEDEEEGGAEGQGREVGGAAGSVVANG
jgi:hypothetical protein